MHSNEPLCYAYLSSGLSLGLYAVYAASGLYFTVLAFGKCSMKCSHTQITVLLQSTRPFTVMLTRYSTYEVYDDDLLRLCDVHSKAVYGFIRVLVLS